MTEEDDILTPVAEGGHSSRSREKRSVPFIQVLCGVCSLGIIGLAMWYFAGFAENDQGIIHLLTAFAFSLGLAALALAPVVAVWRLARQARPSKTGIMFAAALLIPWLIVAYYMGALGGLWLWGGLGVAGLTFIFIFWLIKLWRKLNVT